MCEGRREKGGARRAPERREEDADIPWFDGDAQRVEKPVGGGGCPHETRIHGEADGAT